MGSADERIDISTAVAIRGATGFFFGALRWIEPKRILIEVDAELESGEEIDVRITLAPTSHTALLNAVVARPLVTARGEVARYVLDIVRISADERILLDDWMRNVRTRGTFSKFDTVVSSHRSGEEQNPQANAEVRKALERMARKPLGGGSSPPTDPFGVRSDIVTGNQLGAGRGAVRDALRGAIARNATARPPGLTNPGTTPSSPPSTPPVTSPPSTPPSARSTPPADSPWASTPRPSAPLPDLPSVPPSEPYGARSGPGRVVAIGGTNPGFPLPSGTRPGSDPSYATTQTRAAHWMEVRWHSPITFDRDCRLQILNYILVLQRGPNPLPDREPLRIMLRHEELQLECGASIKAHGPQSATYRLLLDALQIERLKQWTFDYGRK